MSIHDEPLDAGARLDRAEALRKAGSAASAAQLGALSDRHPDDVAVAYQAAWAHDSLGLEAEAVPFYQRALTGDRLAGPDRRSAYLGLGSTLRVLGRYPEAATTLRQGLDEFPDDASLRTFLAMALYNVGEPREAVSTLLHVITETNADPELAGYRRAIEFYADHLDATV